MRLRAIEFMERCSNILLSRCVLVCRQGRSAQSGELKELQLRDSLTHAQRAAVFIMRGNGIEIVHNQIRGLPRGALANIGVLTRDNIDAFQQALSMLLRGPSAFANFPAIGIMLFSGSRVVIRENLLSAQVGIIGFLLINARIQPERHRLAGGHAVSARAAREGRGQFRARIVRGTGAGRRVVDLDVTSNEFLGLHGVIFMSAAELVVALVLLLVAALGASGLGGTAGLAALVSATKAGGSMLAGLSAVSLVMFTKFHRNVFLSLMRGIYKTDSVVSMDMSVIDNTFEVCSVAAIELGDGRIRRSSRSCAIACRCVT